MKKLIIIFLACFAFAAASVSAGGSADDSSTTNQSETNTARQTGGESNNSGAQADAVSLQNVEIYPQIGQEVEISSITYSPDGKYILTADRNSISGVGSVKIWDAENGRELKTLFSGYRCASSSRFCDYAEYSPNGRTALLIINGRQGSDDTDGTIRIIDVETSRTVRTLRGHSGKVNAAVFSTDGRRIVSGGSDKTVKIWNAENGEVIRTITGHNEAVDLVAWEQSGRQIASFSNGNNDRTIRIWNAETGQQVSSINLEDRVKKIEWNSNGSRIILSSRSSVTSYDVNTGQKIQSLSGGIPDDAVFSDHPNGNYFIMGSKNGFITVRDTANSKTILTFGIRRVADIPSVAWRPDGKRAAAASGRTIRIWDMETGRLIRSLNGHTDDIGNVVWSPDGRRLASTSGGDNDRSVKIWDAETGQLQRTINGPFSDEKDSKWGASAIAWSPNGKMLATGSWKTVKTWNPETGRQQWAATVEGYSATDVSFSTDSQQIFVSINIGFYSGGKGAQIFTAVNGRVLKSFDMPKESRAVISPDWKQFVPAVEGGFWIHNAETGAEIRPGKRLSDYPSSLTYSPDGKRIMIGQGSGANIYDVETTNSISSLSGHIADLSSASYSPDGKWILSGSSDGTVRIWNAETSVEKARLISFNDDEWLAITPDGYYVASSKGDQYLNARLGNTVSGIDSYRSAFNKPAVVQARLSNSARMESHRAAITSVAVNPGGTRIASVSLDGSIKLWDLESGKELRSITGIGGSVNAISFSPDGKNLVHGAEDKTVRIWDAETGRQARTISGHNDYVNEARYSPDGKRIASVADDKLVKIWDAETGREIRTLTGHTDMVGVVSWSPDNRRIASGSIGAEKTIRIWDAESGRALQTITGQSGRIMALAYSPDGKTIASCTMEEPMVKIWDAESGRLTKSIPIDEGSKPISLAWTPDGARLVVGSLDVDSDGYIEIREVRTGTKINGFFTWGTPQSVTYTPDGRRIVAAVNFNDTRFIRVYDALSGREQ